MDLPKFPEPNTPREKQLKLTPEVYMSIVNGVKEGNYLSTMANANGIIPRTLSKWLQIGKGEHPTILAKEPYISFARDLEAARAKAEVLIVNDLRKEPDWRAKAWWLERGPARDRWGPNVTITAQLAPAVSILDTLRSRAAAIEDNQELIPLELPEAKETKDAESRT